MDERAQIGKRKAAEQCSTSDLGDTVTIVVFYANPVTCHRGFSHPHAEFSKDKTGEWTISRYKKNPSRTGHLGAPRPRLGLVYHGQRGMQNGLKMVNDSGEISISASKDATTVFHRSV
jgi:hypothetical protein